MLLLIHSLLNSFCLSFCGYHLCLHSSCWPVFSVLDQLTPSHSCIDRKISPWLYYEPYIFPYNNQLKLQIKCWLKEMSSAPSVICSLLVQSILHSHKTLKQLLRCLKETVIWRKIGQMSGKARRWTLWLNGIQALSNWGMKQNVLHPILNKSHCNQSTKGHITSKTL